MKNEEADGEWELDEEEEEEEEEESEIEDGEFDRWGYMRHTWKLVASWSKIDLPEAYRHPEKIMIDDFNIGWGIPRIDWPEPVDKKIGPISFKSVSIVYLFQVLVVYGMDFDLSRIFGR